MIAAAQKAVADTVIDENYNNLYELVEGVKELPKNLQIELTAENELTIYDCPADVTLAVGDVFVFFSGELPLGRKVQAITTIDHRTIITTESVDTENVFVSFDIQGSSIADLTQAQAVGEDVMLTYIVGGTVEEKFEDGVEYASLDAVGNQEISAFAVAQSFEIPQDVRTLYELPTGMDASFKCTVTDIKEEHRYNANSVYLNVSATVTFTSNVSLDVLKAVGANPSVILAYIPVGGIGFMDVSLEAALQGEITACLTARVSTGVSYQKGDNLRLITNFEKQTFSIQAKATASLGIKAEIGVDMVVLVGRLYARTGAKATVLSDIYDSGTPKNCLHFQAYQYAEIGAKANLNLPGYKQSWSKSYVIYDVTNSPVRVVFHYEDGVPVEKCTRGEDGGSGSGGSKYKYYTPADSKYGYSGASKGTGSNGEPYTIFEYSLDSGNMATITKYKGNASAVSIPDTLDGYQVVGIGNSAFANNTRLRVVAIPDSVTKIGVYAFQGCTNLANVTLSKGLTTLGYQSFNGCKALTSIEIPKSLTKAYGDGIEKGPFSDCPNLSKVTFEEGTTQITEHLFAYCDGITGIEIPDSVTTIGASAFYKAPNLENVTLHDGLLSIENSAFNSCSSLKEVLIPDTVTRIGTYVFTDCIALAKVHLPNTCTKIPTRTFYNCPKLAEINFSSTLETIQDYAFYNCDVLTSVVLPEGFTSIEEHAFDDCATLTEIILPASTMKIGSYAFRNCDALAGIVIPDAVTTIGTYCFYDCEKLGDVNLGTGITSIPTYCFYQCPALKSIIIPYRVTKIDNYAFNSCIGLTEITLPRGLTSIGSNVFSYPSKMTIYGVSGTYAETYAKDNHITFVSNEVHADTVTLGESELTIVNGAKYTLVVSIAPANFTDEVTWRSSDEAVVTVTDTGVITAKSIGEAIIRVTAGNTSASCKVKVVQPMTRQ